MRKLIGSLLILAGGGFLWWTRMQAGRRRRTVLSDLEAALHLMSEEIRMARTPMPQLLRGQAETCGTDVQALLCSMAASAAAGEGLADIWREGISALPLEAPERELLLGVELQGDEEKVCKTLSLASSRLARQIEEWERKRPEEVKRTSALCFSGAALLVLVLI